MTAGSAADGELPLSALLSQALVAFTVEFDNEAERLIEHRTSGHGGTPGGVWLVSMAMWLSCMRYAGEKPITVGEMRRLARGDTNLAGMRRWGYVTVRPGPADSQVKPRADGQLVMATAKGMRAKAVWQPLTAVIEQRWRERYGADAIDTLTDALQTLASQLGSWLPDCMPILGYGLFSAGSRAGENRYLGLQAEHELASSVGTAGVADAPLPWLIARVLLAFAIDFEVQARISLAIAANVLRLLEPSGVRVRDLPVLGGVSVESVTMATGYLGKRGLAVIQAGPAGQKWKVIGPTEAGLQARDACQSLLAVVEGRWRDRFGAAAISALRRPLERLAGDPLLAAIEPYPGGWRARVRRPVTLPHYPMVLHRGGFPDGS